MQDLFKPETKQQLVERINRLTSNAPARWGKMNSSQMLAHCQAQIRVALGDEKLIVNPFVKLFGGWIRKKVLAEKPYSKNLPTSPSFMIKSTPDFQSSREGLIRLIERFDQSALIREPHPLFGKLTPDEWSRSTWKHLDHHLSQFGV